MAKFAKTAGVVLGAVALVAGTIATGGALGIVGAGLASTASTISMVAGIGAGIANITSTALAKPPKQQAGVAAGSITQVLIAPDAQRPYPMGEIHFGGVLRHREGYGGTIDGVPNPYLFDVVVYSGVGPIESITPQVDFTAVPAWYSGYLATDTQLGAMPEASALTASYGTPGGWTSAHKLSGHAAISWNLKFDKAGKKFASGFPLTGALLEGVRVYDPRFDDTFPGGSGSHRLDDETTWEYSDNPALHAGTYAYGRYANGIRVMGIGLPVEGVDFATVAAWASVCTANDWTIGGIAFEPGDRWANLKDICAAGGGEPAFSGAVLSFRYDAPVVALDTVTEADVLDGMGVTFMQSYRDRLNAIVPKYRSADHNWEIVAAEAVVESDLVTLDGEERREEWPFNFVTDKDQAAQLAAYKLRNSREFHPIRFTGMPRLRNYRPGDCLHLRLPRLGLDTPAVLLERRIDPGTMTVELTFVGETDAKHAYCLGQTAVAPPVPTLGQTAQERDETAAGSALPPGYITTKIATSYTTDADPADGLLQAEAPSGVVSIAIENHTRTYADIATPVSITGATLTEDENSDPLAVETLYHIAYDDATRAGGAVTFVAYLDPVDAATSGENPVRHYVGSITTPAADETSQGGGSSPPGWTGPAWWKIGDAPL